MDENFATDIEAVRRLEATQRVLEVVSRTTGLGFAAVARVTDSRWIACAVRDDIAFGLHPGGELVVNTTICDEIRDSREAVVIDDVNTDEEYCNHPTPKRYGFRSYISVPIILPNGEFFGTLCAIDPRPANLKRPEIVEMFKLFASLLASQLETELQLGASERALLDERSAAQLREQFIAVLGHDLRNPLHAIQTATLAISLVAQDEKTVELCRMMDRSVSRMSELLDNVLDLTRGRLGGGIKLRRTLDDQLPDTLAHVISELRSAHPHHNIIAEVRIPRPILCDRNRVAQLLSNLLGNALAYGDQTQAIRIVAKAVGDDLAISVENGGKAIPAATLANLFQPFFRGGANTESRGLGLGLYIASEIAAAHAGTLKAESSDSITRFSFRMPATGDATV